MIVHHNVEELGDMRLENERCHPRPSDPLRVHNTVRAATP
jgi:hypothetical protein